MRSSHFTRGPRGSAPGSISQPRFDWCDGWMWPSHCNNTSISVLHCLALSRRCVLCALAFCSQQKTRFIKREEHVFPLSLSTCPSSEQACSIPTFLSLRHRRGAGDVCAACVLCQTVCGPRALVSCFSRAGSVCLWRNADLTGLWILKSIDCWRW